MLSSCWDGHDRVHRLCVGVIRTTNSTSAAIGLVTMRLLQSRIAALYRCFVGVATLLSELKVVTKFVFKETLSID